MLDEVDNSDYSDYMSLSTSQSTAVLGHDRFRKGKRYDERRALKVSFLPIFVNFNTSSYHIQPKSKISFARET